LYQIVTGDEKWIYYVDNLKRKKLWRSRSTSTSKRNIRESKVLLCI